MTRFECRITVQACSGSIAEAQGEGAWKIFEGVGSFDVWALNERELTAQEKEDIRRLRERNGVVAETEDINMERVVSCVVAVGEGSEDQVGYGLRGLS